MAYSTVSQMISMFGADEVAGWSAQDNTVVSSGEAVLIASSDSPTWPDYISEDEQAIAAESVVRCEFALYQASMEMDSYLTMAYELPLADIFVAASILPTICANIARSYLSDGRQTEDIAYRVKIARAWLKDLAQGIIDIPGLPRSGGLTMVMPEIQQSKQFFKHTRLL